MSFYDFSVLPIFLSLFACWIHIRKNKNNLRMHYDIPFILIASLATCFIYPFANVYLNTAYHLFNGFIPFCFYASAIAISVNVVIYLLHRIAQRPG